MPVNSEEFSESTFIHDVSNALLIATYSAEILTESLAVGATVSEPERTMISKLSDSLKKIEELIKRRKKTLLDHPT